MKVGLIARSEDRGLGNLTREWHRNMQPERTLIIRPTHDLETHFEWYKGTSAIPVGLDDLVTDHPFAVRLVRDFLDGLDVVYSAETFYDWRIVDWARAQGVATVCHMMPEYHRADYPAQPDAWWTPTRWRLDKIRERVPVTVVPVPIALDRFEPHPDNFAPNDPIRWLHPVGARAAMDRNGTMTFLRALEHLREPHHVMIKAQEQFQHPRLGKHVTVEHHEDGVRDYWDTYFDADAVVLPRKYGGLCMPALEAMASSCALVMPGCSPNLDWPIIPMPFEYDGATLNAYGNSIPLAQVQPKTLAALMDDLARNPERVGKARANARIYAEFQSWGSLEQVIREHLGHAIDSARNARP